MTARNSGIGNGTEFNRAPVGPRPEKTKPPFGTVRKPLKRKPSKRPMGSAAMQGLIEQVMLRDGRCVACDLDDHRCDGRTDAHHLVSQSRLRRVFADDQRLPDILSDARNAVALCRSHHGAVEARRMYLTEEVLPVGFRPFVRLLGFDDDAEVGRIVRGR